MVSGCFDNVLAALLVPVGIDAINLKLSNSEAKAEFAAQIPLVVVVLIADVQPVYLQLKVIKDKPNVLDLFLLIL